jgi:hypothetical protein
MEGDGLRQRTTAKVDFESRWKEVEEEFEKVYLLCYNLLAAAALTHDNTGQIADRERGYIPEKKC